MDVKVSSGLTIRPFKVSDANDFLLYGGDDNVTKLTKYETFKPKETAQSFIEQYCIPHPYCRSICLNDCSIGYLLIDPGTGANRCRATISYMLAAKYWGKGIVAKALKMAIVEAFKELTYVVRMEAFVVHLENKASERVLEKVGFKRDGLLRNYIFVKGKVWDMVLFSLLPTDVVP